MQKKSVIMKSGLDAMPLFLLDDLLVKLLLTKMIKMEKFIFKISTSGEMQEESCSKYPQCNVVLVQHCTIAVATDKFLVLVYLH